jgi:hypothetical protein
MLFEFSGGEPLPFRPGGILRGRLIYYGNTASPIAKFPFPLRPFYVFFQLIFYCHAGLEFGKIPIGQSAVMEKNIILDFILNKSKTIGIKADDYRSAFDLFFRRSDKGRYIKIVL